jgi:hypothetical protein
VSKKTEKSRKPRKLIQTEKTEPNRFEPVLVLKNKPNRTKTGRFDPVSVRFRFFLKKNLIWLFFFYKNQTEQKIIIPTPSN